MKLFENRYTKQEILERIGDISQIGGLKQYVLSDGMSRGIRAVDLKNGNGFDITVLLDRGMDISDVTYKGASIVWKSSTTETHPLYFDKDGNEWLRTFHGGLLLTCGLTYFGPSCEDEGEQLGLHGRISNIMARNVSTESNWEGDDCLISVKGKVRESSVLGDKLEMERKISMKIGEDKVKIEDTIENIGFKKSPLMTLYHMNFGFPLIDNGSKLELFKHKTVLYLDNAVKFKDDYQEFIDPIDDFIQQVYLHDLDPDNDGNCNVIIVNKNFENNKGLGVRLKFNKNNLPFLNEWIMMRKGEYVVGIEPTNAPVRGRATERKEGYLKFIEPQQAIKNNIEIEILKSNNEIADCLELIKTRIQGNWRVK
jgi:hypothetical protein